MYAEVSPRDTALALFLSIPFVFFSSALIWTFISNGDVLCFVSRKTFYILAVVQAVLAGLMFGLWLHISPCALFLYCNFHDSDRQQNVRNLLMFVGGPVFALLCFVFFSVTKRLACGVYRYADDSMYDDLRV